MNKLNDQDSEYDSVLARMTDEQRSIALGRPVKSNAVAQPIDVFKFSVEQREGAPATSGTVCSKCWWPFVTHSIENTKYVCPPRSESPVLPAADMVAPRDLGALDGVDVHPLANSFPMISAVEWADFVGDIAENGVVQPIIWSADGGTLVDGRNRLTAWVELGNTVDSCPSVRLGEGDDEFSVIVSLNISRRQMTNGQRACSAARAYDVYAGRAELRMRAGVKDPGVNLREGRRRAADECGSDFRVGGSYVDRARKLMINRTDLFDSVEQGKLTMNQAWSQMQVTPTVSTKPEPGKWDATLKTLEGVGSADVAALMGVLATRIGMRMTLNPIQ